MKKTITIIAVLLLAGFVAATIAKFMSKPIATILAPNALHTTASRRVVSEAIHAPYEELRLKHFMDVHGAVRFPDDTSEDKTTREWAHGTGPFVEAEISFEDFQGRRVTINDYSKSENDSLVVWRYAGGGDPQEVSVILQQHLAKAGVLLK